MTQFTPFDWYWLASDGRLYSSATQSMIKKTDQNYKQWQDIGNLPTPWPKDQQGNQTNQALQEVLAPYGIIMLQPSLDEIKAEILAQIDKTAEIERLKYITDGTGQAMTYQEKVAQAVSYTAAFYANKTTKTPNPAEYPLLTASLGIDGDSLNEVAENITYAYAMWQKIGSAIETVRLKSKHLVMQAPTVQAAQTALLAIQWPKP